MGHVGPPPSERTVVIPDIAPRVIDYRELSITADTEDGQKERERERERRELLWMVENGETIPPD